jgi:hypothetical protein
MEYVQDGDRVTVRRFVSGTRSRMETKYDGQTFVNIQLGDAAGTMYVLMPEQKRAMKMSLSAMQGTTTSETDSGADTGTGALPTAAADPSMELVGTETVNGRPARKYRVDMPDADGFVWLDADREVPLRMEAGGQVFDMKNYDFAPVPEELFQVPKEYEVTDLDQMMEQMKKSVSTSGMAARGVAGAAGARLGGAAGSQFGATAGAAIGGALGGPIGAMIGSFLGGSFGKKAGSKVGGAAAGAAAGVIP